MKKIATGRAALALLVVMALVPTAGSSTSAASYWNAPVHATIVSVRPTNGVQPQDNPNYIYNIGATTVGGHTGTDAFVFFRYCTHGTPAVYQTLDGNPSSHSQLPNYTNGCVTVQVHYGGLVGGRNYDAYACDQVGDCTGRVYWTQYSGG